MQYLNVLFLLQTTGYIGLFSIIFAESGLFFGFFFPGDSLLFTAGFLASQHIFSILILLPLTFLAAVFGDNVGYAFGKKIGPKIFTKEDSIFFHKDHIERAEQFYKKHGSKTIILARFIPVVRTFAPIVAGVGSMSYRTFFVFNLIGGFLWSCGLLLLGYFLGNLIPNVDQYLLPIICLIIFLSFLPVVKEVIEYKRK